MTAPASPQDNLPVLEIQSGPHAGHSLPLDRLPVSFGRKPENDIPLPDNRASGSHARIEQRNDDFYIIDLDSTNGTFVNDERVHDERRLQDGDTITIGMTDMLIRIPAAAPGRSQRTASQEQPAAADDVFYPGTAVLPKESLDIPALGYLAMTAGTLEGEIFPLYENPETIGRESDNTISLMDAGISGHHARIQQHNGSMWIIDLESKNGTEVNGTLITEPHLLKYKDRIKIGVAEFVYAPKREAAERVFKASDATVLTRRFMLIGGGVTVVVLALMCIVAVIALTRQGGDEGLSEEQAAAIAREIMADEGLSADDVNRIAQSAVEQGGGLTTEDVERIAHSSVLIAAVEDVNNPREPVWTGSGTVISTDGRILTNCHVACGAPNLVIFTTDDLERPATPRYIAEVTASSPEDEFDLATLQITHNLDGSPVDAGSLNLSFLELGNSDNVEVGDSIYIFGYPGAGGPTITISIGSISGFVSEAVNGTDMRVFIKTDASISSGSSGGTAVDVNGQLVGVPTAVSVDQRTGQGIPILMPVNLMEIVLNP